MAADPFDPESCFSLSECLRRHGQKEQAEKVVARWRLLDADLKQLRRLHLQAGNDPHNPEPRFQSGEICLRNGQEKEALRWFAGALQIDPHHVPTHQALARHYEGAGNQELADMHRQLILAKTAK